MQIIPSISLKQATAAAWLAALDSAAGQATIEVYTGTKPAGPDTDISAQITAGTIKLLGTGTCSTTTATITTVGDVVTLVFNAITADASADDTGTATWARIKNDSGVAKIDVDVSNTGGGGFFQMNTISVVAGGPLNFASLSIIF